MTFEIYIDSLFFRSLLLNLGLLFLMRPCMERPPGIRRIFLGAVAGAVLSAGFLLLPIPFFFSFLGGTFAGTTGMLAVVFPTVDKSSFGRLLERSVCLSFLEGGLLSAFFRWIPGAFLRGAGSIVVWMLVPVICLICGRILGRIRKRPGTCLATLRQAGKTLRVKALWDSGNSLREPISGSPVSVIDDEVFQNLWKETDFSYAIPFRTVDCPGGIMRGYRLEELLVEGNGEKSVFRNVYVAVSPRRLERGGIKMILNPDLTGRMGD